MTGPDATPSSAAEPSPKPRLLVRLLAPLFVLAVSGVFALGVGELAVRLVKPQQLIILREDLWMPADTIGHRLRPNVSTTVNTGERTVHVYTDADGFRIGEAGRRDAPVRVLLIGDSFAEAIQVEYEQSYAHLIERGLSEALGREVVVRNAGVSDWSPNNYLIRARQLLGRDSVDLVIVTIFAGNDAISQRREYFPPRTPVATHALRFPRSLAAREVIDALLAPVNDGLEKRSHLFILLKNQFAGLRMRLGVTADYLPLEFRRSEATSVRWRTTAEVSRALADTARALGTPTLFVIIPERIQVYEEDFQRYLEGFGIDSSLVDLDQPTRELATTFAAESLHVLDALAAFQSARPVGPKLFGTVDQHLSPEGHRVLSSLVVPAATKALGRP
jgi:lysophospholipase L1-like esterase